MRIIAITWALVAALGVAESRAQAPSSEAPVVAAASDLQFALTEVAEAFKRETGQDVKLTFDPTTKELVWRTFLKQKIEDRAKAYVEAKKNLYKAMAVWPPSTEQKEKMRRERAKLGLKLANTKWL
jgi:ABC-type molybdate transport system substrate-binding protein